MARELPSGGWRGGYLEGVREESRGNYVRESVFLLCDGRIFGLVQCCPIGTAPGDRFWVMGRCCDICQFTKLGWEECGGELLDREKDIDVPKRNSSVTRASTFHRIWKHFLIQ